MGSSDYSRVSQAIRYLEDNAGAQPTLEQVAAQVGLSPFHFQRLFRRWAGVSPKQFLQATTVTTAKRRLRDSESVLEAAFSSGLSGPGRLHDLMVTVEAMTPGEYKRRGAGTCIRHGFVDTPFGEALLASTDRGVCYLAFVEPGQRECAREALVAAWNRARHVEETSSAAALAATIFGGVFEEPLRLCLRGTNFQLQVWRALLRIPEGALVSYGQLARRLGRPTASRALASAVGRNPVAYLVPCHRVLRSTGALGGYRWGLTRKRAILGRELTRGQGDCEGCLPTIRCKDRGCHTP